MKDILTAQISGMKFGKRKGSKNLLGVSLLSAVSKRASIGYGLNIARTKRKPKLNKKFKIG